MEFKITNIHINEYISGELKGNDLVEFEKLLAADTELQQQIKVHQQIDEVLSEKYVEVNQFNESVYESQKERLNPFLQKMNKKYFVEEGNNTVKKTIEQKIEVAENKKPNTIIRQLLPFATLAAAAAFLLFVFNPFAHNLSSTQLADNHFEIYNMDTSRDATDLASDLENGQFAYKEGNYEKALLHFNTYLTQKPNDPKVLLAKGNCTYQLKQYDSAIETFQKVIQLKTIQSNAGHWYLALSYLKKDRKEDAKITLNAIDKDSKYYQKAKELLSKL